MEFDPRFQRPRHFSYLPRTLFPSNHHSMNQNTPPPMFAPQSSFLIPNTSSSFMANTLSPTFAMRSPSSHPIYGIPTPSNVALGLAGMSHVSPHHPVMFAPTNNTTMLNPLHGFSNHQNDRSMWCFQQRTVVHPYETTPPNSPASSTSSFHSRSSDSGSMIDEYISWSADELLRQQEMFLEQMNAHYENIIKGQWTPQEDSILVSLVNELGTKKWAQVAEIMQTRLGKQCRERWNNHLKPGIKKDAWTIEEDITLIEAHQELGNKWSKIAERLPGRSENTIKNHWNGTKRRRSSVTHNKNKLYLNEGSVLHAYIKSLTEAKEEDEAKKPVNNNNENNEVQNCGCDELALLVGCSKCPHQCAVMNGDDDNNFGGEDIGYDDAMAMAEMMGDEPVN